MKKVSMNKFVSSEVMKIRRDTIARLIDNAIVDVEVEIELHKSGEGTEATLSVLIQIQEELCKMKIILSPKNYMPTYNYIIRDSWGDFPRLGEKLLKIAHDYKEKLD